MKWLSTLLDRWEKRQIESQKYSRKGKGGILMNSTVKQVETNNDIPVAKRQRLRIADIGEFWILGFLVFLIIIFTIVNPKFFTLTNFVNTTTFMTDTLLLALAETMIIITAGIDLSVGALMGLSHIVTALILQYGEINGISPGVLIPIGILGGLATGVLVGFINGVLITKMRIAPFITTLGMMGVCTGLTFIISKGTGITNLPVVIGTIGNYVFANVLSFSVIVTFIIAILIYLLLDKTRFGRYTYAIGSNLESAKRAGINVDRHLIKLYSLSGLLSAVAGVILVMRFVNGSPLTGSHMELNGIAAVVIGGTSLFGGRGTVIGSVIGACITAVLVTGLVLAQVQSYWQIVAIGVIIILAVYVDQIRHKGGR
jgi:ribose transport system permease protein